MATYRKRNGKWQAIVRHKDIGTRARSFHTKQAAIKWAVGEERKLTEGVMGVLKPSDATLGQLLQRYVAEVLPAKRGAATEGQRLQRLIRDPVSSLKVSQLTSQAVATFRDRRLLDGRRTCHYDLILIRHCLKIAMNEWGLMLSSNPVDRVKMPPSSPARNRRLEDGEFDRLEEAARQTKNPHIWPVIVFAIETGMRRGEILGFRWEHVDWTGVSPTCRSPRTGVRGKYRYRPRRLWCWLGSDSATTHHHRFLLPLTASGWRGTGSGTVLACLTFASTTYAMRPSHASLSLG